MEPTNKKARLDEVCSTVEILGHMESFIPRCHLITTEIFKYLSGKDMLNLSKASRAWFHPCREYIQKNQALTCYLVLDRVDGLGALHSLEKMLDYKILGWSHPFNGVHLRFKDPVHDFFKVGTSPTLPVEPQPEPEDPHTFHFEAEDISGYTDYDEEHYDYTQDYESFEEWMYRMAEEVRQIYQDLAKVDRPVKRILAKIPLLKHVRIEVDYGTKRIFNPEKFKRFLSLIPPHKIEHFRTNLRISEFIGNLHPGQLSKLRTIHIDGLMNALPSTLQQLFALCPNIEKWSSPIPGTMVASFGPKRYLIKNLILYNFVKQTDFTHIRDANLSLTTLIANASTCPIRKRSFNAIVALMRDQSDTLETIQMSHSFLKYVLQSDMKPIPGIRTIIVGKCPKATMTKALEKFPNACFAQQAK